jgi:hypothetical protein
MRRHLPASYLALGERETALDSDLEVVDADTRRLLKILIAVLEELMDQGPPQADPGGQRLMRRIFKELPFPHDLVHLIEDEASLRATGESVFHPDGILDRDLDPLQEAVWQARQSIKH